MHAVGDKWDRQRSVAWLMADFPGDTAVEVDSSREADCCCCWQLVLLTNASRRKFAVVIAKQTVVDLDLLQCPSL